MVIPNYCICFFAIQCLVSIKGENIFFSGGQDLCLWNEKGELLDKVSRSTEHCKGKCCFNYEDS